MRQVCERLDVVDNSRTSVQTLDGGEGRLLSGMPAFTLEGFEQTGFFSANIRAGSGMKNDLEIVVGAKDFRSQKSFGLGFRQRLVEHSLPVAELAANVDECQMAFHRVSSDDHAFDQLVRITLDDYAILTRPGFTLVGVTAQVDRLPGVLRNKTPLQPSRKARAASPTQSRRFGRLNDFSRR